MYERKKYNSMEQSPTWEADSHSASQDIPCLVWYPKVHYRIHNSQPLVPIVSQMHPVYTFPPNFPKILSNIIFRSTPRFSELSFFFRLSNQTIVRFSKWGSSVGNNRNNTVPTCHMPTTYSFRNKMCKPHLISGINNLLNVTGMTSIITGIQPRFELGTLWM
jgi:hypothetical protein